MEIAVLSVVMNQGKVQQQAGISVMKLAMNVASAQGDTVNSLLSATTKSMGLSVQPHLGASVDVGV